MQAKIKTAPEEELTHSPELNYLNRCWSQPQAMLLPAQTTSFRWSNLKQRLKHRLFRFLFLEYAEEESKYRENLVRLLNEVMRRLDYGSLVLNDDLRLSLEGVKKQSVQHAEERLQSVADEVTELRGSALRNEEQTKMLQRTVQGLERILLLLGRSECGEEERKVIPACDYSYLLLENRYRGSEEEIGERLKKYLSFFTGAELPVLEIGAGRGELQELFREQGIPSYGVETDQGMAEYSKAKGLDVRTEDGIAHAASLPDRSLGGLIAVQVIEHLPREALLQLLRAAAVKVMTGRYVIFESVNVASVAALSQNYFRDPTHVPPLHPETVAYFMEREGFRDVKIEPASPYPQGAMLQLIPENDYMTPGWADLVKRVNANLEQLNRLLYGAQDYFISAITG